MINTKNSSRFSLLFICCSLVFPKHLFSTGIRLSSLASTFGTSEEMFLISIVYKNTITRSALQLLTCYKKHSEEKQFNTKYSYDIRFSNIHSKKIPQINVWHNFFFLNTFTSHLLNACDAQIWSHSLEITPGKSHLKRLLRISCAFFG